MTRTTAAGAAARRNSLRPWMWGGAACLLLLPALAMQLGAPGVVWTAEDFVAMGLMLAVACGLYELGAWLDGGFAYRAGFGLAVLTAFLTVWVNVAVGMLGDEGNRANIMFAGVLAIAALGAILGRGRAPGMSWAMFAAACAQLMAAGAGLAMGFAALEVSLTACFALPWLAAGLLFLWAKPAAQSASGAPSGK
ncbi:hypothetical protein [Luteimonas sp. MC1572]|uniref:hypothetical protein n=1 Tax=Luteimonas sp. MC1572 TaxID=2799325 RepID=UPI0018F0B6B2|nr:hypothetical protein [Luteimonas sp. MC1572]MBJ6980873.1 hypothetical protein [Luteimonas sp. MC1572]QQO02233.1 hypothetical protein JGR64_08370 [Luteimonas sp. MC1572]